VTNRLAIFDCDGTLVDSQHSIAAALADAFTAHDLPVPPPHESRRVVGLSLVEAMAALLPGHPHSLHVTLADSYKSAFQRMRARDAVDEPLFEGIAALLDALEADGWLLGVATGKSDRGLGLCLDCHGLAGRFVTLQTADRHPSKPHPSMVELAMAEAGAEPSTTLMIGDTSFDILMARAAGVTAIGVAWGYHAPQELWEAGAHHVAAHPLEVLEFAREQA
jgi:phosphoglycolate phosphatase